MANYKITTSKPKIVIHCEEKSMTDNLVITNEIYMGEFEEISSGYTLTLWHTYMSASAYENSPMYYSIDSGVTWVLITADILETNMKLILNNVSKIKFKVSSSSASARYIGTTEGGNDIITYLHGTETNDIEITQDTTLYIGVTTTN